MEEVLERAAEALRSASRVLVVTGAGISAESGIPTFRGQGGLWEGFRAEDLATPDAFARDPERVWRWYRWRRDLCLKAEPNAGHRVVAQLETMFPEFMLATQNVDGLHRRAGSTKLIELHGNIHRGRCSDCGDVSELPESELLEGAPLPTCAHCGGALRPHIVWFGESYWPGVLEAAYSAANKAQVVLVVGTSARVWVPVAIALHAQKTGAVLIDVNPEENDASHAADVVLQGPAGEVLPALWTKLKGDAAGSS